MWNSIITIRCISSLNCSSAGDALRELDAMNVIRSDPFILISGDVVSNINLRTAMEFHKKKRNEDSHCIMTMVLKKVKETASAKPIYDDLIVGMNKSTGQIVLFDNSYRESSLKVPLDLIKSTREISLSFDFLDCNVDICSPELLLQFSDNFDYHDIRKDFIHNEVCNVALGKHIYNYQIENEYAARVQDPRSYHSICRDIVTRWVYPLAPDVPLDSLSTYTQSKRYIYKEQNCKIARSAILSEEVVIGRDTSMNDDCFVAKSIIGRACKVGSRTKIIGSHIWNNVVIEDNVIIEESIICENVVIRSGCKICKGTIISFGVVVEPNTILPEFSRLTMVN
jgi:translation initiation factor eIF-2B subunit epsilon